MIGIECSSYDFTKLTAEKKTSYLYRLTKHLHRGRPNTMNNDYFYSGLALSNTVLTHIFKSTVFRYTDRIVRLFVQKFYHEVEYG